MKKNIKLKLRSILLTAAATLINNNVTAEKASVAPSFSEEGNATVSSKSSWNKVFKNVAKITSGGDLKYIASHRSHMSHRSGGGGGGGHYSHSSHYSSYGGGSSHYSSSSSSSYRSSISTPTPRAKTAGEYSYGDRTLKSGIHGSDVTALTGYLATKLYLDRNIIKEKEGYSLYDATIASSVKHFQKDAGLPQTGIADSKTMDKLESWDSENTTVILGTRTLSYNESQPEKGTDVTELVNLLTKAGFPPDPTKIIMKKGKTEYTKDIQTAVRFFQAYNKLSVTGDVDRVTFKALRK